MKLRLVLFLMIIPAFVLSGQSGQKIARTPKINYDWQPGFVSITEATYSPGLGLTNDGLSKYYYGITSVAGYQFTRNIKTGVGAGIHIHEEGALFPLFLDVRYSFSSQEFVPFISGCGGVMFDFATLDNTRVFINPSAGIKYVMANRKAITFSTGLMVTTGGPNARKSFVNFRLGLELKPRK